MRPPLASPTHRLHFPPYISCHFPECSIYRTEPNNRLTLCSDARRYFKQSEIVLYRQAPEIAPNAQIAQQQQIQQQQLLQQQQQQQPLPPGSATPGPGQQQNQPIAATAA